jgi:hypothetical protein
MRALLAIVLLSSTAYADRSGVWSLGVTGDARATGSDFSSAAHNPANLILGARLTMAFEDAPMPIPAGDWYTSDTSIVPELLAGFLADDTRAEGYVGAGARLEIRIASNRHNANQHTALYGAARAIVIGRHQDSATEFAVGSYLSRGADRRRLGWELGVMTRPQDRDQQHELDAMLSIYTSWR